MESLNEIILHAWKRVSTTSMALLFLARYLAAFIKP